MRPISKTKSRKTKAGRGVLRKKGTLQIVDVSFMDKLTGEYVMGISFEIPMDVCRSLRVGYNRYSRVTTSQDGLFKVWQDGKWCAVKLQLLEKKKRRRMI